MQRSIVLRCSHYFHCPKCRYDLCPACAGVEESPPPGLFGGAPAPAAGLFGVAPAPAAGLFGGAPALPGPKLEGGLPLL